MSTWSIVVLSNIPHNGVTLAMDMLVTHLFSPSPLVAQIDFNVKAQVDLGFVGCIEQGRWSGC